MPGARWRPGPGAARLVSAALHPLPGAALATELALQVFT